MALRLLPSEEPEAPAPRPTKSLKEWLKEVPTYEAFAARLRIVPKNRKLVAFVPNRVQRRRMASRTSRDIILKARQQGVTTEELIRDLWHFLTIDNAAVCVIVQTAQDHKPLDTVAGSFMDLVRSLERDEGVVIPWRGRPSSTYFELQTGAVLSISEAGASAAAAAKKGRAGTLSRVHATEFAYWDFGGETWNALIECVPEGEGEIVIESTPNGSAPDVKREDRDLKHATGASLFHWLYQDAKEGRNGFHALFFEWFVTDEYTAEVPPEGLKTTDEEEDWLLAHGATQGQLQFRRNKLRNKDGDTFAQEYPRDDVSCFLLSGRCFFDRDVIAALLLRASPPLKAIRIKRSGADGELRLYKPPEKGCSYVIPVDTSEGTDGDPAAAHVYERATGAHCATLDGMFKPWELAREVAALGQVYGNAVIAVERNNHGGTVLRCLYEEQKYLHLFVDSDKKLGWSTSPASRAPGLDTLEEAIRAGHWSTRDKAIIGQLRTFIVNDQGRPEGARGAHDEHPMTAMIGWNVLCRAQPKRKLGDFTA